MKAWPGIHRMVVAMALAGVVALAASCGGSDCEVHEDCASDEVCLFGETSQCVRSCRGNDEECPSGLECDECATSSCPLCQDCVAACVVPP